jgi:hypothetical protein
MVPRRLRAVTNRFPRISHVLPAVLAAAAAALLAPPARAAAKAVTANLQRTPASTVTAPTVTAQVQLTPPPAVDYTVGGATSSSAGDRATQSVERAHWTDPFGLDLSASTWVPLSVGPELTVELPGRLLAQVHLGWMPEFYSHTMTSALEDAGAYDAEVGDLVDGVVQGATTWRISAGWRPFERAGLELTVGYAHVALDGATRTSELIPFVPADDADELNEEIGDIGIDLDSSIHHVTIAAGWRWLIADHLVIRANVGYLQAFASDSKLDIEGRPDLTDLAAPTVESVLHDHYMRYIKIPVVGLGVGYRFF